MMKHDAWRAPCPTRNPHNSLTYLMPQRRCLMLADAGSRSLLKCQASPFSMAHTLLLTHFTEPPLILHSQSRPYSPSEGLLLPREPLWWWGRGERNLGRGYSSCNCSSFLLGFAFTHPRLTMPSLLLPCPALTPALPGSRGLCRLRTKWINCRRRCSSWKTIWIWCRSRCLPPTIN